MAKAALLNVLKKTIGKYVDGLDADSLNVGLWSGQIDLNNVSLRPDAVDSLHLPLKVKRGFVGSINVKVPWTKLGSQSVVITVREVYLTVEPQYRWDKEDLAKMEQQAALAKLEQLEIVRAAPPCCACLVPRAAPSYHHSEAEPRETQLPPPVGRR